MRETTAATPGSSNSMTAATLDAQHGRNGDGGNAGRGGGGGTATEPGSAGSHPGCGSEPRTDGAYMFGGLTIAGLNGSPIAGGGGGAGLMGGGAGGGGDCFLHSGFGGGGGGSSYVSPTRWIMANSRLTTNDLDDATGSLQIFGASALAATGSDSNAQVAVRPMYGWWACAANKPPEGSKANLRIYSSGKPGLKQTSVNVISWIGQGASWRIQPDPNRGAFVLANADSDAVLSLPSLITVSRSSRVMAWFWVPETRQAWYLNFTPDFNNIHVNLPGPGGGVIDADCSRGVQ